MHTGIALRTSPCRSKAEEAGRISAQAALERSCFAFAFLKNPCWAQVAGVGWSQKQKY